MAQPRADWRASERCARPSWSNTLRPRDETVVHHLKPLNRIQCRIERQVPRAPCVRYSQLRAIRKRTARGRYRIFLGF
eukprot:5835586-Prymnesium_polylepis.2